MVTIMNFSPLKKAILIAGICLPIAVKAQNNQPVKPNWQNLDLKTDSVFGISTEKAYNELLKGKPHVPVLVAVIDGGVDINHEDLKRIIWTNPNEIAGNSSDDDKNGYADDIHGWDFIGSAKGDVHYDNTELVRTVNLYTAEFKGKDTTALAAGKEQSDFYAYQKARNELNGKVKKARRIYAIITNFNEILNNMVSKIGKSNPVLADFNNYSPETNGDAYVKKIVVENLNSYKDFADFRKNEIDEGLKHYSEQLNYHYNLDYDPRSIVGDNYNDSSEHFYGNNDVTGPDADHGTHVSGIIGADRENDIGVKGVANDVRIMSVRTVPDGDERDKDVANAIRYAANNGARVINMSFGKSYSFDKKAVDEALKFAMSKDVMVIHAAGNDNEDNDKVPHFPTRIYEDKSGEAAAWIEVGASGINDDKTLKASFSNYGKTSVDVFAPGVKINSTTPNSTYTLHDGTSMAAPVVSGLAALIRSYYPKLTALQVKEIIMKSVVKVNHKVNLKVGDSEHKVSFDELCISGGIVNAYGALKLAATY